MASYFRSAAIQTKRITKFLLSARDKDVFTWEMLSQVAGESVRPGSPGSPGYGYLRTALRRAQARGVQFRTIIGVGIQRHVGERAVAHIKQVGVPKVRRAAVRVQRALEAADCDSTARDASLTSVRFVRATLSKPQLNNVREFVREEGDALSPQETRKKYTD